jgi:hypothetical protein
MCNTDKAASQHLPMQLLLFLVMCVSSLAVHFIAEELVGVAISPRFDLTANEVTTHLPGEHGEDNFIVPYQTRPPAEQSSATLQATLATGAYSFLIPPLLPPPNI